MNKEQIKEFRKEVDALILKAERYLIDAPSNIQSLPYKREINLVTTKLQEAKMWLGQCLGKLGSTLPVGHRDFSKERKDEMIFGVDMAKGKDKSVEIMVPSDQLPRHMLDFPEQRKSNPLVDKDLQSNN